MSVASDYDDSLPDPSWDLDRLASYTRDRFEEAELFGRRTAVQIFRAGRAILLVKEKLKAERRWTVWAQEHGLPLTSVYEAIKIAERFEVEEDITGLTAIEARMIAGTVMPRGGRKTKGDGTAPSVTNLNPRDERPVTGGEPTSMIVTAYADGDTPGLVTDRASVVGTHAQERPVASEGWFERLREELLDEVAAIEDTVLFVQEWADRQDHPISAALLRVLIESEQITVVIDDGKEVVRVDDHEMIAALAAAETFLDPIFARLGITPEIAARHLLDMIREGHGIAAGTTTAKPNR